jgi:hypothetical protein
VASATAWGQPVPGYGRPGGGVRPDHPTPTGRLRYGSDLHDAADDNAISEQYKSSSFHSPERRLADDRFSMSGPIAALSLIPAPPSRYFFNCEICRQLKKIERFIHRPQRGMDDLW